MLFFSSLLKTNSTYKPAADSLFAALDLYNISYKFITNTKDIWLRDFLPVKTGSGKYISFKYEPSYLRGYETSRTDYRQDISFLPDMPEAVYSEINIDGGNIVFSPSKGKAVISDRVFFENSHIKKEELVRELERLLEARVIVIPSLKSDMTGHADGMVRFTDENTALCNAAEGEHTLEQRIADTLRLYGITVAEFPYFSSRGISAEGCYINYLETEKHIFLPIFGNCKDTEAVDTAQHVFSKTVVPVRANDIAKDGGIFNCISWEDM